MTILTWLHLSDLHFRAGAHDRWNEDIVVSALLDDVRELMEAGLSPDLILISGDLAYQGAPADYALACEFLDQLRQMTKVAKQRILVVPGNHDVDRTQIGVMARRTALTLTDRNAVNELLADADSRRAFLTRFGGYAGFLAEYFPGHLAFDDEHYFYVHSLDMPGFRVSVLGLNSAWLSRGGAEDRHRLALGERQVRAALKVANDADLRIALLHHPFEWLHDFERNDCQPLLLRDCDLILHGHLHEPALTLQQTPDARAMIIAAGASYETRESRNSYNLVQLDMNTGQGTLHLRAWSDWQGGFWTKDTLTFRNLDNGQYTFDLAQRGKAPPSRPTPIPQDTTAVVRRYTAHLLDRYRYLEFKGMGISDRVPLRLPLVDMYIPLKARTELPERETWTRHLSSGRARRARDLKLAGREVSAQEADAIGQWVSEPLPLVVLLQKHDGLVVLGDPGAGKTTFLKYLALTLAQGEGEVLGLSEHLPVLLPLSAYANALAVRDVPLDEFIATYYHDLGVDLPLRPVVAEALAAGRVLVLLDGLDEVRDLAQRHLVTTRVADFFAFHHRQGNKFILTSRIVGYREVRLTVDGMAECTLVDFGDDEIGEFVARWTEAVERAARGETPMAVQEAAREREELMSAIRRNQGVRQLAANPLLLTILAMMKRQGVTLPERRVELYQKYLDTLIKHWNLARGLGRPPSHDLDMVETVRVLAPLALWMHETSPGVGLVNREAIRRTLEVIYSSRGHSEPELAARQLLADAREYAGLLVERGPDQYGFIHLTFQEYLAAVAIAQRGQQDVGPVADILSAHIGDDNWHEVSLLAIGYMGIVQQRDEAAGTALRQLIEAMPGRPGEAALLAGQAVLDAWPGGVTAACRQHMTEVLATTLVDDARVEPRLRAEVGHTLADMGDPRFRLDDWFLPSDPLLGFVEVPAGPFLMGRCEGDIPAQLEWPPRREEPFRDAMPQHSVTLPTYYMARYPVTVGQFRAYVEATGVRPREADFQIWPDNYPVTSVNWNEVRAYCTWLNQMLQDWAETPALLAARLRQGWTVHLPTEAEWEKAARGTDAREYPWGDEFTQERCNTWSSGLRAPSAVGMFPSGASPFGALDMAGNVFEWCQSLHKPYPYRFSDGRENLEADGRRVLRGGSYVTARDEARCTYRSSGRPNSSEPHVGFRVVLSACSPDFGV